MPEYDRSLLRNSQRFALAKKCAIQWDVGSEHTHICEKHQGHSENSDHRCPCGAKARTRARRK